jgi:general secretion pathway protein I
MRLRNPFERVKKQTQNQMQTGFALIEVLVGLAVLSIALIAGLKALASAADTQLAVSQRTQALWSADNALADLRMNRQWPEIGTTTFSCPQDRYVFVCQRKVLSTPNPSFRRIELTVYLTSSAGADVASGPRLAWLTTILPNPAGGSL